MFATRSQIRTLVARQWRSATRSCAGAVSWRSWTRVPQIVTLVSATRSQTWTLVARRRRNATGSFARAASGHEGGQVPGAWRYRDLAGPRWGLQQCGCAQHLHTTATREGPQILTRSDGIAMKSTAIARHVYFVCKAVPPIRAHPYLGPIRNKNARTYPTAS